MADFRAKYYMEAERQIRESLKLGPTNLDYWALLLSALVNATMSLVSDDVLTDIIDLTEQRASIQRQVQYGTRKQMKSK